MVKTEGSFFLEYQANLSVWPRVAYVSEYGDGTKTAAVSLLAFHLTPSEYPKIVKRF